MFDPFFNLPHWLPRFDCGRTGHAANDLPSRLCGVAQVGIGLVERLAFHAPIVTDQNLTPQQPGDSPSFETDDDRAWFLAKLPTHEELSRSEEWRVEQCAVWTAGQDNRLENNEKHALTPQDGPQVAECAQHLASALQCEAKRTEFQASHGVGLIGTTLLEVPTSRNQRNPFTPAAMTLAHQLTESRK